MSFIIYIYKAQQAHKHSLTHTNTLPLTLACVRLCMCTVWEDSHPECQFMEMLTSLCRESRTQQKKREVEKISRNHCFSVSLGIIVCAQWLLFTKPQINYTCIHSRLYNPDHQCSCWAYNKTTSGVSVNSTAVCTSEFCQWSWGLSVMVG